MTSTAGVTPNPLIVLCAPSHADVLVTQFSRYAADYDVRLTSSSAETLELLTSLPSQSQVALLVTETEVPDEHVLRALYAWRAVVPTARRIITAHMEQFRVRSDELRPGLATGKYDAYLLMPRGVRDEEFHTAVTELLSDWGSAAPVVASMQIVSPTLDAADRGDPRLRLPDGDAGRGGQARLGGRTRGARAVRGRRQIPGGGRPRRHDHPSRARCATSR